MFRIWGYFSFFLFFVFILEHVYLVAPKYFQKISSVATVGGKLQGPMDPRSTPAFLMFQLCITPLVNHSVHSDHLLCALAFVSFDACKFDACSHFCFSLFFLIRNELFQAYSQVYHFLLYLYLPQKGCLQRHIARYTWVERNYIALTMLYYRIERSVKAYGFPHKL